MSDAANDQGGAVKPMDGQPRGSFEAVVKRNIPLCTDHYKLLLSVPRTLKSAPGQFVQIDCTDPEVDEAAEGRSFEWGPGGCAWQSQPGSVMGCVKDPDFNSPRAYLRRPFSIAGHRIWPDGYSEIEIIHRVIGKGTTYLQGLKEGQKIAVIGPLGRGFDVPDWAEKVCLVAGGVGIPPMFYLARSLRMNRRMDRVVALLGAQRVDLLPVTFSDTDEDSEGRPIGNVDEFSEYGYPTVITTDDGSRGMKGYVTQALERFLASRKAKTIGLSNAIVFCCGPTPMMKATARIAENFGVPCQVSLEQPMACGMGTCQSCVIKFRPRDAAEGTDWKYKLTCTEGPVFDSRDLVW